MIIINEKQGYEGWHKARLESRGASEAPIMAGKSKHQSRDDLLKLKKTGIAQEVSAATQNLFDRGHCAEAAIRPYVEEIIGEDLFPVVGKMEGSNLLASFDGLTMMQDIAFEHKLWNQDLAAKVSAIAEGKPVELDEHYTIQMDQQLLVSGAEKVIFVTSDGTPEKMAWCWYETTEEKKAALLSGWAQFEKDLESFEVKEVAVKVEGEYIPALPALRVQINGSVTESNLATYKDTALAFIKNINTTLVSDQDFANAEKTVKFCKDAEQELEQVKKNALSQTASIDDLFRTVDSLSEAMRAKRLELDKLVKSRKEAIKISIAGNAKEDIHSAWVEMTKGLDQRVIPVTCPVASDVPGAMKGKKTIKSLEEAANNEVARVKIEANKIADKLKFNLVFLYAEAQEHKFLFNDIRDLLFKEAEDFKAVVLTRIAEHDKAEQARLEAERETIRLQEEAKAQAAAKAAQEAILAKEREEAAREQAEARAKQETAMAEERAAAAKQAEAELEKMRNEIRMEAIAESVKAPVIEAPKQEAKAVQPPSFMQELGSWAKSKGLSKDDVVELICIINKHAEFDIKAA